MSWARVPLKKVAPAEPARIVFAADEEVWHLTLDQVESDTGRVIFPIVKPAREAGTSTFVFDDGNVLYSKLRPYLNKVVCPDRVGISTSEMIPLRPNPKALCRRFLTYYLRSSAFVRFASQAVAGVKMPRIIMDDFWSYELPLPALSEQRRIVEILDQADALRQQRRAADEKAKRILPALFHKMFGDPATNPKGLDKKPLGKLLKLKSGDFLPAKAMDSDGVFPVYGGNGINGYHSDYMFEDPVIVLGRVGAYCGVVHFSEPKCWVTDNALYVSECDPDLRPGYLTEALRLANLNQYAGRAGQPLISGNRVYPVEILVPPPDEQERFEEQLLTLKEIANARSVSGAKVETLFQSLLHRAFAGELTAQWREARKDQLEAELREQLAALEQTSSVPSARGRQRRSAR